MTILPTQIDGLIFLEPQVFKDERGFFMESYNRPRYEEAGIHGEFVQDNHSLSRRGTVRGLHYQTSPGQAKILRCTRGKVWDVAVDIRPGSPTFGKWEAFTLDTETNRQIFIPVGFAHGFCVLSDIAEVQYKCTSVYNPKTETGIAWNDPDIAVEWPVENPVISARDHGNESFREYAARVKGKC